MTRLQNNLVIILALITVSLSACGGGSNTPDPDPDQCEEPVGGINPAVSQPRISAMNYDFDNNGTAEGRAEITYDDDGFVTSINYTYTDDGTIDTDFRGIFSLDFGDENKTKNYEYDCRGRITSIVEMTATARYDSYYTWNNDDQVTNLRYEYYDAMGALTNTVRFDLTYNAGELTDWSEEFEVPGSAPVALAEGDITYDATTNLPELLSRTQSLGGLVTEDSSLTFLSSGQIQTITTTRSDDAAYESGVRFSYAWAGHPGIAAGTVREGDRFSRIAEPNDPADNYTWGYSYSNSRTIDSNMTADTPLLATQYIDMDPTTQVVFDAAITFEWEEGNCRRNFIWAPRAEPNFIASSNEPYVPGTGYARIDYCATRGSIE